MTLPELHLADWRATKDTLHLYAQIVGKIRLATTAPRNHWSRSRWRHGRHRNARRRERSLHPDLRRWRRGLRPLLLPPLQMLHLV